MTMPGFRPDARWQVREGGSRIDRWTVFCEMRPQGTWCALTREEIQNSKQQIPNKFKARNSKNPVESALFWIW
jgi:hypothetical protein